MRILALEHDLPGAPRPDLRDILRAEAAAVWDLQKHGFLREIWFTAGRRRAVIILECTGAPEARSFLATLPLVREGLSEFEVLELSAYDGYERLFGAGLAPAASPGQAP